MIMLISGMSDALEKCKSAKSNYSIHEFTSHTEPNGMRSLFMPRQYAECFR